jgi:hypothetical protein
MYLITDKYPGNYQIVELAHHNVIIEIHRKAIRFFSEIVRAKQLREK